MRLGLAAIAQSLQVIFASLAAGEIHISDSGNIRMAYIAQETYVMAFYKREPAQPTKMKRPSHHQANVPAQYFTDLSPLHFRQSAPVQDALYGLTSAPRPKPQQGAAMAVTLDATGVPFDAPLLAIGAIIGLP
jgi:hypothetical protein